MLAPAYQDTCQRNAGGEAIQFVGIWSPISFRPFEEGVNDVDQRFWRSSYLLGWLLHQLVVNAKFFVSVRSKLDLLAVDLDVLALTSLFEKRLWEMSHNRTPLFESGNGKQQRRMKSSQNVRIRLSSNLEPAF